MQRTTAKDRVGDVWLSPCREDLTVVGKSNDWCLLMTGFHLKHGFDAGHVGVMPLCDLVAWGYSKKEENDN